jgi:hypothetical protein
MAVDWTASGVGPRHLRSGGRRLTRCCMQWGRRRSRSALHRARVLHRELRRSPAARPADLRRGAGRCPTPGRRHRLRELLPRRPARRRLRPTSPSDGHVRTWSEVTGIHDKRSGALVTTRARSSTSPPARPWRCAPRRTFCGGEGGFGQSLGEPAEDAWERPEPRARPRRAHGDASRAGLIYRLTGDPTACTPTRSWPPRPGSTADPARNVHLWLHRPGAPEGPRRRALGYVGGRFSRPVFPGDELVVSTWRTDDGLLFETATATAPSCWRTASPEPLQRQAAGGLRSTVRARVRRSPFPVRRRAGAVQVGA